MHDLKPPANNATAEDLREVVDGMGGFVEAEVLRRHQEHAELLDDPQKHFGDDGRFVPDVVKLIRDVRMASAEAGYFTLAVPEHMGGAGMGYLAYFLAWERVYSLCTPHHWLAQFAISHWAYGPSLALDGLTEEATERVWPQLMSGEDILCFGMSEPDAGSDAMAMRTTASPVDGGWVLNGRKIWTTHAPIADWMVVFAVTDAEAASDRRGGISAFLVPMDAPGLSIHGIIKMWGDIGGTEAETAFDDVFVEPWQMVGPENKGFTVAMKGVSLGRLYNSARAVATGSWAMRQALEYAEQRQTFGQKLADHQAVGHPIAEAATRLHAARLLAMDTASLLDSGHRARKELAMMKYLAIEAANLAVDRAIQTHGAIGFSNELGFVDALRTFRSLRVADGTDEILLRTVLRSLRDGDTQL